MIQFSLYKLELPLKFHDHVLQLSHTEIIENILSCICQFRIYYYNSDNIIMLTCTLFFAKTKLLLDWHSMSHVVIKSLINDHVHIFTKTKVLSDWHSMSLVTMSLVIACRYDWNAWLRLLRHTLSHCMKHLYIIHLQMINAILFSNILFLLNYCRF